MSIHTAIHPSARGKTCVRAALMISAAFALSACQSGTMPKWLEPKANVIAEENAVTSNRSVKLVERDVEAPDAFQVTESGLWDGRPSLGGVWVAHPDVTDPERVIIRNEKNGKFVIGALFRRERETPGPSLQVSSDAAAAVGMLAGQPAKLNVTALRRETVADGPDPQAAPQVDAPSDITSTALAPSDDAPKAIQTAAVAPAAAPAAQAPKPAAPPSTSGLGKPFIQLGIFSVEQNANNTAEAMRVAGMIPTVKKQTSRGKTFWRVVVGPAQTSAERSALLKKIKASGFSDAYAVTN